jgi:isopentenyl diphosphate isomerase/L-lactate dehydrogenase-like FMN-dependent dehydrogenase
MPGARQALDVIRAELEVAMTLTGTRDIGAVKGDVIG